VKGGVTCCTRRSKGSNTSCRSQGKTYPLICPCHIDRSGSMLHGNTCKGVNDEEKNPK